MLCACACKIENLYKIACYITCLGCGLTRQFRVSHTVSNRHRLQSARQTHCAG